MWIKYDTVRFYVCVCKKLKIGHFPSLILRLFPVNVTLHQWFKEWTSPRSHPIFTSIFLKHSTDTVLLLKLSTAYKTDNIIGLYIHSLPSSISSQLPFLKNIYLIYFSVTVYIQYHCALVSDVQHNGQKIMYFTEQCSVPHPPPTMLQAHTWPHM